MCGIAGFFGNFDSELLVRMGESLSHRGPDGQGEVLLSSETHRIGLAHRRLAIIDPSPAGKQPMAYGPESSGRPDRKNSIWITFNGEIYNFRELRKELESRGHYFRTQTDTEVILNLYAEYGTEAFLKLNGIFAIALYDGRISGQKNGIKSGDLLLYRDGLGVKPLYYAQTSQGFLFASEIKALLCSDKIPLELDLEALKHYLSFLYAPAPHSPLASVRKIEPGQWLLVRQGKIQSKSYYYDIPYGDSSLKVSEDFYIEELRRELKSAVTRQLVSDVPVGAFLSGGLDSSSVVALMKQAAPSASFDCFTIGYKTTDASKKDDLYYAKKVAAHMDLPLTIVNVEPEDFRFLEKVVFQLDEPQADPAAINTMLISKKARELGIKVLLSGAGGDDIFAGYSRHLAVELEKIWRFLPRAFRNLVGDTTQNLFLNQGGVGLIRSGKLRKVAKVLESLKWETDERISGYLMSTFPDTIRTVLGKPFEQIQKKSQLNLLTQSLDRIEKEKNLLNRMLYLEAKHFLADHNLNYVDKMSMSQGVEVRVPLIDRDLVNFVAKLPPELKRKNFENKYLFKRAVQPFVPAIVANRPKQGFGLPLRNWLNTELKEIFNEALSESSLNRRGLFNSKEVLRLIKLDQERKIDASQLMLSLLCIELWCRQFLDRSYSAPTTQSKERVAEFPL